MKAQHALYRSPGVYSGLFVKRAQRPVSADAVCASAARLFEAFAADRTASVLVALQPELLQLEAPPLLPRQSATHRFPSTQAQLLVQVAADTREALLGAHRRVDAITRELFWLDEELLAGRIGDGREPFGFRDGIHPPTPSEVESDGVVASGPLAGSAWILYLRFEQRLERFALLGEHAREQVMGIRTDGTHLAEPARNSHVGIARRYHGFVRRGFPCRANGVEGLAFVGVSAKPEHFRRALDAMLGTDEEPPDALLRYATAVSGGLYLAPPDAAWLRGRSPRGSP